MHLRRRASAADTQVPLGPRFFLYVNERLRPIKRLIRCGLITSKAFCSSFAALTRLAKFGRAWISPAFVPTLADEPSSPVEAVRLMCDVDFLVEAYPFSRGLSL